MMIQGFDRLAAPARKVAAPAPRARWHAVCYGTFPASEAALGLQPAASAVSLGSFICQMQGEDGGNYHDRAAGQRQPLRFAALHRAPLFRPAGLPPEQVRHYLCAQRAPIQHRSHSAPAALAPTLLSATPHSRASEHDAAAQSYCFVLPVLHIPQLPPKQISCAALGASQACMYAAPDYNLRAPCAPQHVITQGLDRPAAPVRPAAAPVPRVRLQIACCRPYPAAEAALGLQPAAPAVLGLIQHCHESCSRALVTQLCIEQVPHQASPLYARVAIAYAHRSHARKQAAAEQTARACGNSGCA